MALIPVVAIGGDVVVLSLDVDASRTVVGWQCVNRTPGPCLVRLSNGAYAVGQAAPGNQTTTATVPRNRQWGFDSDSTMTYELTMVWGG